MIDAAVLRAMAAAGATTEVIIAAVEAAQAADEARREAKRAGNAERQQRFRDRRKARKEGVTQDNASNALRSVTPPIDITHTPQPDIPPVGGNQARRTRKRAAQPVPAKPDEVSDQVWADFLDHRTRLGTDVSETVIAGFRREADRVGWPLEQALSESILRGWRGFKAEWIKDNDRTIPSHRASPTSVVDIGRQVAEERERRALAASGFRH